MTTRGLILLVLFATVATVLAEKKIYLPKDLTVGKRVYGDDVIQREIIKVKSKWLQIVQETRTIALDDPNKKITQVKLLDQNKKGKGATPIIVAGGPDQSFVTLTFKSHRSHSIDFIVEIYGI